MKKVLCMFLVLAFSSVVFAETNQINLNENGTSYGDKIVQLSNNVEADYLSDGAYFAVTTYNSKGKGKVYLATSESGATYVQEGKTAIIEAGSDTTNWTKL